MTANTQERLTGSPQPWELYPEDELDLRRYLLVLLQWWREILIITLLAGGLAAGVAFFLHQQEPDLYLASSDVVLARLFSRVQVDERISTVVDMGGNDNIWRSSVVQLVKNGSVAAAVLNELESELPEEYRSSAGLLRRVTAEILSGPESRGPSDIVRISVLTESPELSARIADTWARYFIRYINTLYGEIPQETIDMVEADLEAARQEWEAAQAEYERFIVENRLDEYQNELDTKLVVRNNLFSNRRSILATLVNTDHGNRTSIYSAIARTQIDNTVSSIDTENARNLQALAHLHTRRMAADIQLTQAQGLVALLEQGGDPITTAEAVRQLKLQLFAAAPPGIEAPSAFTALNVDRIPLPTDAATLLADARILVTIIEANRAALDEAIEAQTELLINNPAATALEVLAARTTAGGSTLTEEDTALAAMRSESYASLFTPGDWVFEAVAYDGANDITQQLITELETEIRNLRAAIAAENARERRITQRRDLAWTSYETLSNKLLELNLMRTSANSQVRLASLAVPPLEPEKRPSYLLPVVGVTGAAFVFAALLALFVNMMGGAPVLARR